MKCLLRVRHPNPISVLATVTVPVTVYPLSPQLRLPHCSTRHHWHIQAVPRLRLCQKPHENRNLLTTAYIRWHQCQPHHDSLHWCSSLWSWCQHLVLHHRRAVLMFRIKCRSARLTTPAALRLCLHQHHPHHVVKLRRTPSWNLPRSLLHLTCVSLSL